MKISAHIHQRIRLKNGLLTLAILSLLIALAWLSQRYTAQIDLTANASNTLTEASQKILTTLSQPITVSVYIKQPNLQKQIAQLLAKYQYFKADIKVNFIDPTTVPEKARELNIGPQGIIIVEYLGRTEKLSYLDESTLTNALLQLASTNERWITFLAGHGERSPSGRANFDLGLFGKALKKYKIKAQSINLAKISSIPDNSSLLILAAPSVPLLSGEKDIITDYIEKGGNLLLLTDPDNKQLVEIQDLLGVHKLPGTIVDSSSEVYGIDDPSFVLVSEYTNHPVTQNFNSITVFPLAAALETDPESNFKAEALLKTVARSWTESGQISGKVRFDADTEEKTGPLTIAYALTRQFAKKDPQRIIVIGDGDFLSNAYLGNVGNSELGFRLINWLTHDDQFIEIPAKISTGKSLQLSNLSMIIIGLGFLIVLPLALLIAGFIIWRT
ncbi:MAG: GldG family protein, partial [Methylococcales bacterium]|nr:GldG family protein [Methylococcales bacterium]